MVSFVLLMNLFLSYLGFWPNKLNHERILRKYLSQLLKQFLIYYPPSLSFINFFYLELKIVGRSVTPSNLNIIKLLTGINENRES